MTAFIRLGIVAVTATALAAACGSDDDSDSGSEPAADASTTADAAAPEGGGGMGGSSGSGGSGGSGGSTTPPPPPPGMSCGGVECDPIPSGAGMMALGTSCCTPDDECGIETMLTSGCLPRDQPGGRDLACPDLVVGGDGGGGFGFGSFTLSGCCGPTGCGVLAGPGLGCVPNADVGAEPADCDYNPENDCSAITELPCDGAEDCPGTQVCCAQFNFLADGYDSFACMDACDPDAFLLELCHAGDSCGGPDAGTGATCLTSTYLPDSLSRCFDTGSEPSTDVSTARGEVNCGDVVCGGGEKCCFRPPRDPYCAPQGGPCECVIGGAEPDGGAADSGAGAGGDAGP